MGQEPLRVLVCQSNFEGGGQERIALELAKGLASRGIEITLFVHENRGPFNVKFSNFKLIAHSGAAYHRARLPGLFLATMRLVRNADVVIAAAEGRAGALALMASWLTRRPVIGWIHIDWREFARYVSWRTRYALRMYRLAEYVVAVSDGAFDGIRAIAGLSAESGETIYNGIDVEGIVTMSAVALPEEHRHWFDGPVIVAVGRLHPQKGFDVLLRALLRLGDLGHRPQLVLLGSGPQRNDLEMLAREFGIWEQVHFAGFQSNPYAYMARSSLVVVPSRFEGFGLVIAEALAAGAPLIATDCRSGPREILKDGHYGRLVPVEDSNILAREIAGLLEDPATRETFLKLGRERGKAFDQRHFMDSWERVVRDVADRSQTTRARRSSTSTSAASSRT